MAENPRELIRAAQSAETQGDVVRAVECLQKAAELYREAGNTRRALQLLRHAQRLDGSRADLAEAVNRLEWMPEMLLSRPQPQDDEDASQASPLEQSLDSEFLPDVVLRQRLIEDAVREAAMRVSDEAPRDAAQAWVIETEVPEDPQRLEAQLARVAAEGGGGTLEGLHSSDEPSTTGAAGDDRGSSEHLPPVDARLSAAATADDAGAPSVRPSGAPRADDVAADATSDVRPRRRREARLIERGPTRADAALDAWCSFCCRPRTDTGDLVAGPAGAFICKSCLLESQSLLEDVTPVPLPPSPRPDTPVEPGMRLVGQHEAEELLTWSLQAQVRCLLVVGPEGSGKSTWFQQLQREGKGVITAVADLDGATSTRTLLVEDVDRLSAEAQATLQDFLARHRGPAVVLSARGMAPESRGLTLRGDARTLALRTTASLSQAVRGAVPTHLLEHVQVLLTLHVPTQSEFVEIARLRLASREPAISLSEEVLAALAAEAGRSPRAGHELHALLNRVPSGTWQLEPVAKPTVTRKARRKRTS
ncbi:ClpX C4-type zinc finger protein [Myxococcus sp. Y35]|uniref:ClpX C4-type zinc finger protein n=1 Tax=Pseudomyxococcus flavus TaxID=3115648 RepID=UPI003CEB3D4F